MSTKEKFMNIISSVQFRVVTIIGIVAIILYSVYSFLSVNNSRTNRRITRQFYSSELKLLIADKFFYTSHPELKTKEIERHLDDRFQLFLDQGPIYFYITSEQQKFYNVETLKHFNLLYHLSVKAYEADDLPTLSKIYQESLKYPTWNEYITTADKITKDVAQLILDDQVMVLSLVISMLIAFIILQIIAIRITHIDKITNKILFDKDRLDISQRIRFKSKDQLGKIANNLNYFFDFMEKAIAKANIAFQKISYQSNIMYNSSENWIIQTQEMRYSIDTISSQMNHQITSVNQAASALEEMERTLDIIFSNISRQSAAMTQSAATLEEMGRQVESVAKISDDTAIFATKLTEIAEKGNQAVDASVVSIRDVAEYSSQIIKLLKLITGIAKQTNLLAMNASIEAAHAGESGRGFAIVAEEIRRLSETTNKNAKEIGTVVDTMVDKIENSVAQAQLAGVELHQVNVYSGNVADRIAQLNNMMQEQNTATHEMISTIEGLVNLAQEIKFSMEEQQLGLREYSSTMVRLKENFNETKSTLDNHMNSVENMIQALRNAGIRISIKKETLKNINTFLEYFILNPEFEVNIEDIQKEQELLFEQKRTEDIR